MAPIRPAASRAKRPAQISRPTRQATSYPSKSTDSFPITTSKKDKHRIKRSQFISKVQKASDKPGPKKRRRPSKKLVVTLNNLADALPDLGESDGMADLTNPQQSALKTIKSKPGAGKKRVTVEREERARFGQNLALLSQARAEMEPHAGGTVTPAATPIDRWAALRQGIASNMGIQAPAPRP